MRSIAEQRADEMGGALSVLTLQKRDHVELDRLFGRLAAAAPEEEDAVLLQIYRLVFPHAFAEESVLWPVIRRVVDGSEAMTLQVEQEHQEINRLALRLDALPRTAPERPAVLERMVALLKQDVRDEEDMLLPALQARLSDAQLRRLGIAWQIVRRTAPTRPHPFVSRRPPGNLLAALPLTILDRLRDRADARIHRQARPAGTLRTLSAALGSAATGVEHAPGMRAGEDPSTRVPRSSRSRWRPVVLAGGAALAALLLLRGSSAQADSR